MDYRRGKILLLGQISKRAALKQIKIVREAPTTPSASGPGRPGAGDASTRPGSVTAGAAATGYLSAVAVAVRLRL